MKIALIAHNKKKDEMIALAIKYKDIADPIRTDDYQVNKTTVKNVGENTFSARVFDAEGEAFITNFVVPGIANDSSEKNSVSGPSNLTTSTVRSNVQTEDNSITVVWIILAIGMVALVSVLMVIKKRLSGKDE